MRLRRRGVRVRGAAAGIHLWSKLPALAVSGCRVEMRDETKLLFVDEFRCAGPTSQWPASRPPVVAAWLPAGLALCLRPPERIIV